LGTIRLRAPHAWIRLRPYAMNKPATYVLHTLSLVGVVCGALGCAVGPDFETPEIKTPPQWIGAVAEGKTTVSSDPALISWWTTFGDDHLTNLIERAAAANLDVRQARARLEQARASRDIAFAGLFPVLNLSGQVRRAETGGGSFTSQQTGPSSARTGSGGSVRTLYTAGLDASWEIDLFGGGTKRALRAYSTFQMLKPSSLPPRLSYLSWSRHSPRRCTLSGCFWAKRRARS
jgi:hypothetical protein